MTSEPRPARRGRGGLLLHRAAPVRRDARERRRIRAGRRRKLQHLGARRRQHARAFRARRAAHCEKRGRHHQEILDISSLHCTSIATVRRAMRGAGTNPRRPRNRTGP
ncbi:hypothetical protein BMA2583 [Burkholderia mallei ATCC 23344]|uniref:Uncharacterized protein n=1 Tax=Burkholderia mallei (strain ATCC 23344) TaxID=243160 RepID=A0A0H2WFX5_BURMA|nr:hypothetical protein BMA2583 [Burkholderia mallei ATCC 23344]